MRFQWVLHTMSARLQQVLWGGYYESNLASLEPLEYYVIDKDLANQEA